MEKILITGGSGFIGTNLIDHFESLGCNFINFDKAKPYKPAKKNIGLIEKRGKFDWFFNQSTKEVESLAESHYF